MQLHSTNDLHLVFQDLQCRKEKKHVQVGKYPQSSHIHYMPERPLCKVFLTCASIRSCVYGSIDTSCMVCTCVPAVPTGASLAVPEKAIEMCWEDQLVIVGKDVYHIKRYEQSEASKDDEVETRRKETDRSIPAVHLLFLH